MSYCNNSSGETFASLVVLVLLETIKQMHSCRYAPPRANITSHHHHSTNKNLYMQCGICVVAHNHHSRCAAVTDMLIIRSSSQFSVNPNTVMLLHGNIPQIKNNPNHQISTAQRRVFISMCYTCRATYCSLLPV
jgi:hypothetical protein